MKTVMKTFICAANWKLHKNPKQAKEFCQKFSEKSKDTLSPDFQSVIFPPAYNWSVVAEYLCGDHLYWGPQNCYTQNSGAFTGENSAEVALEMGAKFILVGHSERRQFFSETDNLIAQKIKTFQDLDLIPMLCIGETLEQRQKGTTIQTLKEQLQKSLSQADFSKKIVVAYEPVWAIGTGEVAQPEQVQQNHVEIRKILSQIAGESFARESFANETSILYGGSVKPENAANLASLDDVDGFLVGGASLETEPFLKILSVCFSP